MEAMSEEERARSRRLIPSVIYFSWTKWVERGGLEMVDHEPGIPAEFTFVRRDQCKTLAEIGQTREQAGDLMDRLLAAQKRLAETEAVLRFVLPFVRKAELVAQLNGHFSDWVREVLGDDDL